MINFLWPSLEARDPAAGSHFDKGMPMNNHPRSISCPDSRATRFPYRLAVLSLLLIATLRPAVLQAQSCSGLTPAFPVPENLWLDGIFRPGLSDLPGDQIPPERDSTGWENLTISGFDSGHEIFESLDVAGDYLYVAYNAGFSVWNIAGAANGEDPVRIDVRDGWNFTSCQQSSICGPFLSFPDPGEIGFLVEDVAVLAQGANHYIALSGRTPVGISLWQHNTDTGVVAPIYQETIRTSRQVRLAVVDSTIYALSGSDSGLAVYDLSRALAIDPCLEETGSDCPGVFLGNVGTSSEGRYLDILQRPAGELLIASSNGDVSGLGLELWELPDPATPGVATRLFTGLDNRTFGTAMFNYEGNDYLAALERDGSFNVIKIFNVNACGGGSCSLGAPVFSLDVPPRISTQFLTFSTSNGKPFLYYGLDGIFGGPKVEQLLDLTTLGRPGQDITEMTTGGPTYFDACAQDDLGYWAWYYPGNEFGLRNLSPRIGKFDSGTNFFYRAAGGLLDVHVWEPGFAISGTVTDAMTILGLQGRVAQLFDSVGNPVATAVTNASGGFRFPAVENGSYFAGTKPCDYQGELYDAQPWDGTTSPLGIGTEIEMSGGIPVIGIDFDLSTSCEPCLSARDPEAPEGGAAAGKVTRDPARAGGGGPGDPIEGITVTIYDPAGECKAITQTDAQGDYSCILDPGSYYVATKNNGLFYGNEIWPGNEPFDLDLCAADQLTIGDPISVPDGMIDFELPPAGAIAGTVTYNESSPAPIAGVSVEVYDSVGNRVMQAGTDENGDFMTNSNLPAGTYYAAAGPWPGFVSQRFGGQTCPYDGCNPVTSGTPILVAGDDVTMAIDFELKRIIAFIDGFESGDTSHWTNTTP